MRYWNKKRSRKNWYKIELSHANVPDLYRNFIYNSDGIRMRMEPIKLWCQLHPSKGRFYFKLFDWYFENHRDAVHFALRWL